ncbi:HAD domain-containing protein [Kitasatospora camelliae]|uniref:HAD domain-containing protein n=1 Tax=Kitasatospora camelliae TaxID=3156397 RepID=A0AAU8K3V6_9ACTN
MTLTSARPLLLLDIDGPLNPYAAKPTRRPEGYTTHRMNPDSWVARGNRKPLRVWLNHDHGRTLQALPYDLVWCTTWMAEANEWIAPHLGLPTLPYVPFEELWASRPDGTYFKTWDIVRWAQGRPFAWVDDEIGRADRDYAAAQHEGPALLHHVDPRVGLAEADFQTLAAWADDLPVQEG